MSIEPIVKVKNLSVTYNLGKNSETKAINNISLDIYAGEFIILFGPSGCGKSTLLYAISGLETNIEGDIFIDGKSLSELTQSEKEELHQKKTGMIFQAYYLISSITVLRNVLLPQIAIGAKPKERKEKAISLLKKFGVIEQINKLPTELSGGQQQRVAVCRALINEPDILMADEPIGNLDSKSAADVMELLKELNEKQKKTIILVTHDPTYLDYAHRVFHIKDGALIQTKINRAINEEVEIISRKKQNTDVSRELDLLSRSFPTILGSVNNLIPFKSKQIVLETLLGMTSDDISKIEDKVRQLLTQGIRDYSSLYNYLDKEVEAGGLGMDKRTARKIADKIISLVYEVKQLEEKEKNIDKEEGYIGEAVQIRQYLVEVFDIRLETTSQLRILDRAIRDRLEGKIDHKMFRKIVDLSTNESGIGLDKRTAKKVAKRLELLILGKYKGK